VNKEGKKKEDYANDKHYRNLILNEYIGVIIEHCAHKNTDNRALTY